jgi:two-component system, NarL family, nitrate/nitrite response regulator NarL
VKLDEEANPAVTRRRRHLCGAKSVEGEVGRLTYVTAVVSAHALLREGLWRILGAADFKITATAANLNEAMASLSDEERHILLIIDVTSDQSEIVGQIKQFKQRHPTARIALLAEQAELSERNLIAAFRCGADAYFLKPDTDTLLKSLELVMLGETILPPEVIPIFLDRYDRAVEQDDENDAVVDTDQLPTTAAASDDSAPKLSAREQCILRDLIEGHSNKMIARRNDIAEATVKVHVKAILRKIRVSNRTQAAIWGMNHRSYAGLSQESSGGILGSPALSNLPNFVKKLQMKDQSARA